MENFVVSARKYRPATFNTVVGQASITNTLKNAIKNNQLAQAFLFCGPRGVGKTTCARILAKTINCFHRQEDGEACDRCESCISFNNGQSLNIYELDAASNNSVDDIRALVEQVRFAPQLGKYKIYIIDEVHMLSAAAFNAFLKTLEEPPAHAIFILATTEKHKILPTILSRCQKFDFNRIRVEDISSHLAEIAQKENIQAEPDALHVIATKADGGLRDALSMFDQLVSFSGGHSLSYRSVIENLHLLDYDYFFKTGDLILKGNISGLLLIFDEILVNGFDGQHFVNGLAEHFRNLLVGKDPATLKLLEVGENVRQKYLEQSSQFQPQLLMQCIQVCTRTDSQYKSSKNQRLLVEFALMQMATLGLNALGAEKKNDLGDVFQVPFRIGVKVKEAAPKKVEVTVSEKAPAARQSVSASATVNIPASQSAPGMPKVEIAASIPLAQEHRNKVLSSGLSITEIFNSTKKQTQVSVQENPVSASMPKEHVSQDQMLNAWKQYAARVQELKRLNLYNTMMMDEPRLAEGNQIVFRVFSRSQQMELEEERLALLEFMRTNLRNFEISLNIQLTEQQHVTKAYTPSDKYQVLVQKHPLLAELKKRLDLDLEF